MVFYFNIFSCHKRFEQLDPDAVRADKNAKLPSRKIMTLPELRVCVIKSKVLSLMSKHTMFMWQQ